MTANSIVTLQNPKLSDTAMVIFCNAAQRENRLVLPIPPSITASADAVEIIINELLSHALVEEKSAKIDDLIWRTNENEQNLTLGITQAGIEAIDGDLLVIEAGKARSSLKKKTARKPGKTRKAGGDPKTAKAAPKVSSKRNLKPLKTRSNSKANQILALLKRSNGTTLTEIVKATGWQAHSVRGFLSGTVKKRMGLKLTTEQVEGKDRRYKIPVKA